MQDDYTMPAKSAKPEADWDAVGSLTISKDRARTIEAPSIAFRRLPNGADLPLPSRATPGAAGIDLRAAADVSLAPGAIVAVPTGFAVELAHGNEGQIRPRSGLAATHGITVLNSPGTIDSDYRGEIQVILINHGQQKVSIARGDRIAQLVVAQVWMLPVTEVDAMSDTERGAGGLGSTGTT